MQLEVAGLVGLDEGRYLSRVGGERVLVVGVAGAPAPLRRRFGRAKPKDTDPAASQPTVPLTTLTAVRPNPLGDDTVAQRWLSTLRADAEAIEVELDFGLELINRAVHAHRTAAMDPHLPDVSAEHALAVRIGYGSGEALADGRYSEAIELPRSERQRLREALRPQERVAEVLGGRESVPLSESPLLRARADLDAGRTREAALELRAGLQALLAEAARARGGVSAEALGGLEERSEITGEAAAEAILGGLDEARRSEIAETLRLCERVLRQRRLG